MHETEGGGEMLDCRIESVDCSQWLDRGNPTCLLFVQCYMLYNRRIPYICHCIMLWRSVAGSELGTACLCVNWFELEDMGPECAYNIRPQPLCDTDSLPASSCCKRQAREHVTECVA